MIGDYPSLKSMKGLSERGAFYIIYAIRRKPGLTIFRGSIQAVFGPVPIFLFPIAFYCFTFLF